MNEQVIQDCWFTILKEIGETPSRSGLLDTPKRIAKMYQEVFRGYTNNPPKITVFDDTCPTGLIMDSGYFFSMCEHHAIPFFGHYYFGYIPNPENCYLGASKIGRTVDYFAARLQTQEKLAIQIIEYIEKAVNPLGSILIMNGRHLCKEMRGLKKWDSPFEVSEARGILLKNIDGCIDEFLARIGSRM